MVRQLIFCVLAFAGTIGTSNADPFYLYHPRPVFAQPVMAYAPVTTYQPAYVVPTATYSVSHVPVTTVTYSSSYYAPLVPTVAVAPVVVSRPVYTSSHYAAPVYAAPVYSAPVYSAPVYATPVYAAPVYYRHSVHSRLNVYRNGSYSYHLRAR